MPIALDRRARHAFVNPGAPVIRRGFVILDIQRPDSVARLGDHAQLAVRIGEMAGVRIVKLTRLKAFAELDSEGAIGAKMRNGNGAIAAIDRFLIPVADNGCFGGLRRV